MKNWLSVIFLTLLTLIPAATTAQGRQTDATPYLAGAVPVVDGQVRFTQTFDVPGKQSAALLAALQDYVQHNLVEGKDHLEKARITEVNPGEGRLVASIEEYLYFKRKAWTMDRVRFSYQLICQTGEGRFTVEMRRLQYCYDDVPNAEIRYAEDWITDAEALSRDGKSLNKFGGKFRRKTIDRKNEIFEGAHQACLR